MSALVVRHGTVLTQDRDARVIEDGTVVVEGAHITYVGPAAGAPTPDGAEIVEARGRAVLPGLVNCHTHLCMVLGRTLGVERDLLSWLGIEMPILAALDDEAVYLAELLGCVENLKNGNTTVVENMFVPRRDDFTPEDSAFHAMRDCGIRGTVARAFHARRIDPAFCETADQQDARTADLAARWHGAEDGRLGLAVGPLLPWILEEGDYRRTRRLADRLGIAIHMHVAESAEFNKKIAEVFGRPIRQVELMKEFGCLGRDVQAAAVADVSPAEIELLADSGTSVIFDPPTRLFWGTGFPDIKAFLDAGITCGLGTNGPAANCGQDLFESMKYACATAKTAAGTPDALGRHRVLAMATAEGARAIGRGDEIGSLEIGKRADLITVDLDQPHLVPAHDVAAALVYSARGGDVRDAVVDGRLVMRERKMLTVDEGKLLDDARRAADRILAKVGVDARARGGEASHAA